MSTYKINRPPHLRWAIGMFWECFNQAGFAQRLVADYHPYNHWRSRYDPYWPQVGGII